MSKERFGFVTNSSSSSYIIAYKDSSQLDDETLKKYPYLRMYERLVNKLFQGGSFNTKEDIDQYFVDFYDWDPEGHDNENKYVTDLYDRIIEKWNNGFKIIQESVDYWDSETEELIRELAKDNECFMILEVG